MSCLKSQQALSHMRDPISCSWSMLCATFILISHSLPITLCNGSFAECWQGAKYLCGHLEELGATVNLVSPVEGRNPIVIARIDGVYQKPTVVVYGHYDVQPANMVCLRGLALVCPYGRGSEDRCGGWGWGWLGVDGWVGSGGCGWVGFLLFCRDEGVLCGGCSLRSDVMHNTMSGKR